MNSRTEIKNDLRSYLGGMEINVNSQFRVIDIMMFARILRCDPIQIEEAIVELRKECEIVIQT